MRQSLLPSTLICLAMLGGPAAAAPRVVTDIAPVEALAAMVMGETGAPARLLAADADPHHAQLRPSQAGALAEADLVITLGGTLTPWMADAVARAAPEAAARLRLMAVPGTRLLPGRAGPVFDAADDAALAGAADTAGHDDAEAAHADDHDHDHAAHDEAAHDHAGHDESAHDEVAHDSHDEVAHDSHDEAAHDSHDEAAHDHAAGDEPAHDHTGHAGAAHADAHDGDSADHDHAHADAAGTDPHAWLDPANARLWLSAIADTLSQLDPANAELYGRNATEAAARIAAAEAEVRAALQGPAPAFVLAHDSTRYFETAFDLSAAGALTGPAAHAAGPRRTSTLADLIRTGGIACILADTGEAAAQATALARDTAARMVAIDPMGADTPAAQDRFPAILTGLADDIGNCRPGA